MSNTKFTPVPWSVNPVGPHWNNPEIAQYEITYSDAGECIVDHVYKLSDAHLIAAAPEMYEMLEAAQREIANLIDEVNDQRLSHVNFSSETQPDLCDQETVWEIQKLLAKARGEK